MRRAAAIVLGTMTGTALLVGAKYGTPPTESPSTEADGVVVTDASQQPGSAPGGTSAAGAPSTSAKPGQSGAASGAPSGAASPTPPKTTTTPPRPASGLKDGTYKASATVADGHGTLSMTVTITGGRIAGITASESGGETNCYHSACNTLIPEALTAQSASVASVSHATHTSTAFKSALSAVLNSAKA